MPLSDLTRESMRHSYIPGRHAWVSDTLHAAAEACSQAMRASVAQSLLAKAQVILQALDERPVFRVLVRNSLAAYLAEWLLDAAAESAAARGMDSARIANRLA